MVGWYYKCWTSKVTTSRWTYPDNTAPCLADPPAVPQSWQPYGHAQLCHTMCCWLLCCSHTMSASAPQPFFYKAKIILYKHKFHIDFFVKRFIKLDLQYLYQQLCYRKLSLWLHDHYLDVLSMLIIWSVNWISHFPTHLILQLLLKFGWNGMKIKSNSNGEKY